MPFSASAYSSKYLIKEANNLSLQTLYIKAKCNLLGFCKDTAVVEKCNMETQNRDNVGSSDLVEDVSDVASGATEACSGSGVTQENSKGSVGFRGKQIILKTKNLSRKVVIINGKNLELPVVKYVTIPRNVVCDKDIVPVLPLMTQFKTSASEQYDKSEVRNVTNVNSIISTNVNSESLKQVGETSTNKQENIQKRAEFEKNKYNKHVGTSTLHTSDQIDLKVNDIHENIVQTMESDDLRLSIRREIQRCLSERSLKRKKRLTRKRSETQTVSSKKNISCQTETSVREISVQTEEQSPQTKHESTQTERESTEMKQKPTQIKQITQTEQESVLMEKEEGAFDNEIIEFLLNDIDNIIIGKNVDFGMGPKITPICNVGEINSDMSTQHKSNSPNLFNMENHGQVQEKRMVFNCLKNCIEVGSMGNVPLHSAVCQNNAAEVSRQCIALKMRRVSVDLINDNGNTPLHLAIIDRCSPPILLLLLKHGANITLRDREGNDSLHLTVIYGYEEALDMLLMTAKQNNFSVDSFNYEGFTPLTLCAMEGNLGMAVQFLENGANPNLRDRKSGRPPLFHAVENNNVQMVRMLLNFKANTKVRNFFGTSTHEAIFELDLVDPEIKSIIIGKELYQNKSKLTEKRRRYSRKEKKEPSKKQKLTTMKTFQKLDSKLTCRQ